MQDNIRKFDEISGEIFAKLYASFPKAACVDYLELSGHAEEDVDEFGGIPDDAEFCREVAKWLVDANYIWAKSTEGLALGWARLTPKALEVLNMVPDSLAGKKTLGEQIIDAAKSGSKEGLKALVSTALSAGVKLMLPEG